MRNNLIATLILACLVSGCASTPGRSPDAARDNASSLDPSRSKSCYGGPVYVPC